MSWAERILSAAGVVAALGVLWRATRPGRRGWARVAAFLEDWNGEPERPGRLAVPPFPARMAQLERELAHVAQLVAAVDALRAALEDYASRLAGMDDRLGLLDARVSDHRARNEEQVRLLRLELERRIGELGDLLVLGELAGRPVERGNRR